MDTYDPKTVFSSIDHMGRYAYCNQPIITKWNLSRFAECLIPMIYENQKKAIEIATEIINTFEKNYEEKWLEMMRKKLGLLGNHSTDKTLILDLLTWMHQKKVDYTNTFCHLMKFKVQEEEDFQDRVFKDWKKRWNERLIINNSSNEKSIALMRTVNPLVIPRNDKVEETLDLANKNNFKMLFEFLEILKTPYIEKKNTYKYQIPNENNKEYKTFCGT